jgi:hypothetical protein
MSRSLTCLAVVLVLVPPASAQLPRAGEPVALTLSTAAPPVPSLKYRLLPDQRDLVPGNAAPIYYRSLTMFVENRALLQEFQSDEWEHWFLTPLKDLPRKEVADKVGMARYLLHEVEVAAHYRQCDWEPEGRSEGTTFLPPDVSGLRRVAILFGVKARLEMAEGHLPEALQALQTGYTLAHHLGSGPSLGHVLVGEVVAGLMNYQLEELLQQPGAPNLYWALTVLPRPFFDPQPAVQEEAARLEQTWPVLRRLANGPMSAAQLRAARQEIRKSLDANHVTPPDADREIDALARAARKALVGRGLPAEQVEAMPAFQAVALEAVRDWRQSWDEYVKWFRVPDFERAAGYREAARHYREALGRLDTLFFGGLVQFLEIGSPATLEKVHAGRDRLDRQFAALRAVEALRLYAAAHDGKLPASLADVTTVPVPADPVTGKPFAYEARGEHATLSAPLLPGEKPTPAQMLTYDLTLRR